MTLRPGRAASAATISLKRFTEVESATITSPGRAPISRAILPPVRAGAPIQSCRFQLRISDVAHSSAMAARSRSCTTAGAAPSELPSR
jgi:hypothetical protein